MLVPCKARYKRSVFFIIQNVFSVPHSLDLSPFWNVLSTSNKGACRSVFFVTLSFYWVYHCGPKNRRMFSVYGVVDSFDFVAEHSYALNRIWILQIVYLVLFYKSFS